MKDDLFTKPPFDIDQYKIEQNKDLAEKYPDQAHRFEAQTERILSGQTSFNPMKDKFDKATPADQLRMMGIKGGKAGKVYTVAEDKARKASRFAEDNIVGQWAKWFKENYPGIPYVIDRKAQGKSKLRATIERAQDFEKGNPDIHIQTQRGGFIGAYIEQKTSEDIFYSGTRILKPGSDNRMIWQALYHANLREQGYWVMFSVSLEATQKMTKRYMDGNPYPQQVFEYYCKPEDYPIFAHNKFFTPLKQIP